ncbi:cuticle protein-like [Trichoplusia ni]|uniref:Cuticle protein-like n=1 Tax=Trichoplusia ni TaxID=7111 RepID=A0A7E5WKS8_TRINI|nr:cuticle protein-like [Trichoplusia ni]
MVAKFNICCISPFQFVIVLSLAVAASAGIVPYAKVAYAEPEAPAHYEFNYSVHDDHSGDVKQQQESRAGDAVQGSYSLVQPDGVRRIVHYTADHEHGFNAQVSYEGTPVHQVSAKIAYAAPIAKVAYAAPIAKVAYAAPVAKVSYAPAAVSYSHAPVSYEGTPVHQAPAKIAYAAPIAKVAYAAPIAKVAYAAPVAKVSYAPAAVSYSHAPVAYSAPVAKVAYAAPVAHVSYASPAISYHH